MSTHYPTQWFADQSAEYTAFCAAHVRTIGTAHEFSHISTKHSAFWITVCAAIRGTHDATISSAFSGSFEPAVYFSHHTAVITAERGTFGAAHMRAFCATVDFANQTAVVATVWLSNQSAYHAAD